MKLLNKILGKFGLIAIPLKPDQVVINDICFKWNHGFSYRSGRSDEEILLARKTFPLSFELTSKEKLSMINQAEESYRAIIAKTRFYS